MRVLIVDDHLSFTEVVRAMLEPEQEIEVVGGFPEGAHVLILTGSNAPEDLERARDAGAEAYLTKEQIASDLVPTLLALCRRS